MAPILGYWNLRGLATPIRLLLTQAGVEFEEKLYECGPPPTFDRSAWLDEKFTLGLDFPNLPYYKDGDTHLVQSHVILRHLANKHNLAGRNETERMRADELATQVYDYHIDYARTICYNPEFEKNAEEYKKNLNDRLALLVKFLGDRNFAVGDILTYADFVLYEYLEGQKVYQPDVLKTYPTLEKFVERINELPAVKKYFESPKGIKAPFNGAPAFIGGPYSDIIMKNLKEGKQ